MEAPRVDELVTHAIDEQVAEVRQWREETVALRERIEQLEGAVAALQADIATIVTDAARAGVAGEIDRLETELRRQISELGRLVTERGRLPKLLVETVRSSGAGGERAEIDLRDLPYADAPGAGGSGRRGLFRRR